MEHANEVYSKLGKPNVCIIVSAIEEGKVEENKIKVIALQLKGSVHGTFMHFIGKDILVNVFLKMLDTWYVETLHKLDDGLSEFKEILRNDRVGLSYLACQMTHTPNQSNTILLQFEDEKYQGPKRRNTGKLCRAGKEKKGKKEKDTAEKDSASSPLILNEDHSSSDLKERVKDFLKKWKWVILLGALLFGSSIANGIITTLYISLVRNEQECAEQIYQMNRTTRSLTVQKGSFVALDQCNSPQYEIPNMPGKSENVVGIYGGWINKEDHPSPDHPKLCFVHKLCSCEWKEF